MCTSHSVWEIRSQHFVHSREKETKKIKKVEQSQLTWLRPLFPMDGNQKLEGGRVRRTGGSNAKEGENMGGKKKRVGRKDIRGREEQRWREKEKRLNISRTHIKNNKFQIQGRKLDANSW